MSELIVNAHAPVDTFKGFVMARVGAPSFFGGNLVDRLFIGKLAEEKPNGFFVLTEAIEVIGITMFQNGGIARNKNSMPIELAFGMNDVEVRADCIFRLDSLHPNDASTIEACFKEAKSKRDSLTRGAPIIQPAKVMPNPGSNGRA